MDEEKMDANEPVSFVGAYIPQAHHDALRRAAAALDRPLSYVLRELIKTYVTKSQAAIKELQKLQ